MAKKMICKSHNQNL